MPSTSNSSFNDETLIKPWKDSDLNTSTVVSCVKVLEKTWNILAQLSVSLLKQLGNSMKDDSIIAEEILKNMVEVCIILQAAPVVKLSVASDSEPSIGVLEVSMVLAETLLAKIVDTMQFGGINEESIKKADVLIFLLTGSSYIKTIKPRIEQEQNISPRSATSY